MKIIKLMVAGGMVAGGLAGVPGRADVITNRVGTSQELQTALTLAASNGSDDLIYLEAGIYRGGFNFDTTQNQSLTLRPEAGLKSGEVVLDGERLGRVLRLNAGNASANMSLLGLVIRNGLNPQDGQGGSGVYLWTKGDVVVNDSLIVSNVFNGGGTLGGGVYVGSARNVMLTNNTVRANQAGGGAGIQIGLGNGGAVDVFLVGNLISGNTAYGGAVVGTDVSVSGRVVVRQNKLIANLASGGSFNAGISVLIEGNEIAQNSGGYYGTTASAPDVTVRLNVFRANVATSALSFGAFTNLLVSRNEFIQTTGGGVYVVVPSSRLAMFENNIFRGNNGGPSRAGGITATLTGGTATLRFINNTLFDNSTVDNGGGASFIISGNTEILQVYNNILWGNRATGLGKDVFVSGNGSQKNFSFNNYHDLSGLWNIASNNIDVDPLFVDAPNGDFHLRANSLCLNAGLNGAPGLPLVDKDGNVRVGDGVVDIGAYEQAVSDQHPADANLNWVLDAGEFDAYARAWTNRAPWASGPNPIPIDYVTRAGFLLERGGAYHNEGGGKPRNWKPGP